MKGNERLVEVLASYAFGTMLDLKKIQYGFLQFLILSFTFEFSIIYLSMSDQVSPSCLSGAEVYIWAQHNKSPIVGCPSLLLECLGNSNYCSHMITVQRIWLLVVTFSSVDYWLIFDKSKASQGTIENDNSRYLFCHFQQYMV